MLSSIALVAKELGRVGLDRVLPPGDTLPDTGAALTPAFLAEITRQPAGSIRSVTVLDENHGTAGRVRVAIETAPDVASPDSLFVKLTPHNPIQRVMMSVFELGTREVLFYRTIGADVPVRTPRCYGAQLDPRRGRNVIVLEDLTATATFRDIRSPATPEQATAVVDALADLHATCWESPRFHHDLAALQARNPASQQLADLFVGRILGNLKGHAGAVVPVDVQRASRIVFERRAEIDGFWNARPRTLCHGDPHFGNLFFEGATPGFLDWQAVMIGPGIRDVSYFLNASMEPDDLAPVERALFDRYVERLDRAGVDHESMPTWDDYRASAADFYIAAVVTAGTSDRMQPPEISRVGVDRAAAAVQRLETFEVLAQMLTPMTRAQPSKGSSP